VGMGGREGKLVVVEVEEVREQKHTRVELRYCIVAAARAVECRWGSREGKPTRKNRTE